MESPHKKRRVNSQESQVPNASSTPHKSVRDVITEVPSFSGIEFNNSRFDLNRNSPRARRVLQPCSENHPNVSFSNLLDNNSFSSYAEGSIQDSDDEEILDYDAFFKTCNKIQQKGGRWKLYKPIGDEEGSLYHKLMTDPKGAPELAKQFVQYCKNKPAKVGTYILYRFYFDCAGCQKFNLKEYFTYPPNFEELLKTLSDDDYTDKVLITKNLLFADNSRLAKFYKFGIYNFVQKFVLEAHEERILYGPSFSAFINLITCICTSGVYRPLVYTACIFVTNILTAICMVKEKVSDIPLHERQNALLDIYINLLYIRFAAICQRADKQLSTLKIICLKELKIWINYSAKVFVDQYNCTEVLKQLLLDESTIVRLAVLDVCMKIVHDEKVVTYLKAGPINVLCDHVWGRVCDISILVGLKAIEVYTAMIRNHLDGVQRESILEQLVDAIYHEDYRMGSAAGQCVIEILTQEYNDDLTILFYLCKIAKKFHPNLKSLLVESCIDHTSVLENWSLIIAVFLNTKDRDVTIEIKASLSELLLESVHVTLTGHFLRVRSSSKIERSVYSANNTIIANEIYPYLKRIVAQYRNEDIIVQSFFKILVEIAPEYLSKEHCEIIDQLVQLVIKFFVMWDNAETLKALIDYLLYVNQHLPIASTSSKNAIEDLKKYVSEELYKSFKMKNNPALIMAKKTCVVFSKLDLNEHVQWSKLLCAWTIIEYNAEFIENILGSCHWSLMWKLKKLNSTTTLQSKSDMAKEISLISNMSAQFFSSCHEVMRVESKDIKLKAFERICESCISFCLVLENVCKQIHALEVLKPIVKNDELRTDIMDIFELNAEPSTPIDANRFRKYIIYIYHMACLNVIPMDRLSIIFKYFDKYYDSYGKLMEAILIAIREKNENWIPQLLVNAISLLHQDVLKKHGVVDVRGKEAKIVLSLSRRFHEFKKIMSPKIAGKLLVFAVNYASDRKLYDFLIYVRPFTDDIQYFPMDCKEILRNVREKIPPSARKDDSVLYFVEHLHKPPAAVPDNTSENVTKKEKANDTLVKGEKGHWMRNRLVIGYPRLLLLTVIVFGFLTRSKRPRTLKIKGPRVKGKQLFKKPPSQSTTNSGTSDELSIHDTSSDDLEFTNLNISN